MLFRSTIGHWVYTDDFDWLWQSDWDWGWACFHYGRWAWDDDLGWYWVPGYTWGPAWVVWRRGPSYIGWTPLPPQVRWQVGVGLEFDGFDVDLIPARRWVFVEPRYFDAPRIWEHTALISRNVTILPGTRNVTRFEHIDGRVVNAGISLGWLERSTHRHIEHYRVRHVENAGSLRLPHEHDGEINIFSPSVRSSREGFRPPEAGEFERRQEAERQQMQERQRAEQAFQERQHRVERGAPNANLGELQQRQEGERQALRSEQGRESRQLDNRQARERESFQRSSGSERERDGAERERSRGR